MKLIWQRRRPAVPSLLIAFSFLLFYFVQLTTLQPINARLRRSSDFSSEYEAVPPCKDYDDGGGGEKLAPFMTPQQFQDNAMMERRTFYEGRDIRFPIRLTYGCPAPSAVWLKDGRLIDPAINARYFVDMPSLELKVAQARLDDSGEYRFVAKNSEGSLEFVFHVKIKEKIVRPQKIRQPPNPGAPDWCPSKEGPPVVDPECNCLNRDYEVGKNVELSCNVCAEDTVSVEWYSGSEGEELKSVKKHLDTRISIEETANSSLLNVQFVLPKDNNMVYECRAQNRFGNFSFRWRLRQAAGVPLILQPPVILSTVNATAKVGSKATLYCNVGFTGDEILADTLWIRGDYIKLMLEKNVTHANMSGNSAVYLIPKFVAAHPEFRENISDNVQEMAFDPVTERDYGPHTCYYTNSIGASARVVWLLRPPPSDNGVNLAVPLGVGLGAAFCLAAVVTFVVVWYRRHGVRFKPVKKRIIVMTNNEFYNIGGQIQDFDVRIEVASGRHGQSGGGVTTSVARSQYQMDLDPRWEIPRQKIVLGDPIGDGNIGLVVSGKLNDYLGDKTRDVAVKMLRDDATDDDLMQLIKELTLLKQVGTHPNVINFIGCCTQTGPILVVVELARFGNLRDFLRKNRPPYEPEQDYILPSPCKPLSLSDWSAASVSETPLFEGTLTLTYRHLIEFAHQIAKGMEYLSSRGCIHRDLAARNVLVSDNFQLKVSDFGLTRQVKDIDTGYYRRGTAAARLPVKWMAPESLNVQDSKYTTKSDVWSYGILLWEIYSLGENPYRDLSGFEEIIEFVIQQGRRLDRPQYADTVLYEKLFKACWLFYPEQRPTFDEIRRFVEDYAKNVSNEPLGAITYPPSPMSMSGGFKFPGGNGRQRNMSTGGQPPRLCSISEPPGGEGRDSFGQQPPTESDGHLHQHHDGSGEDNDNDNDSGESGCMDDMSKPPSSPGIITSMTTDSQYSSTVTSASAQDVFVTIDETTKNKSPGVIFSQHSRLAVPQGRSTFPSVNRSKQHPPSTSSESSASQRRSSFGDETSSGGRLLMNDSISTSLNVTPISPASHHHHPRPTAITTASFVT